MNKVDKGHKFLRKVIKEVKTMPSKEYNLFLERAKEYKDKDIVFVSGTVDEFIEDMLMGK